MAEQGGPSVQSGILYQNSIAALLLGRLCDMHRRPARERVVEVRVEAPSDVDDIVVRYADGHRDWIQAKENLRRGTGPWKRLWADFEAQRWSEGFKDEDRLVLAAGTVGSDLHQDLRQLCHRAEGALDADEWMDGSSRRALSLMDNIGGLLTPRHQDGESLFQLFRCLYILFVSSLDEIERDHLPQWVPDSSVEQVTLFGQLRDKVGGRARRRKVFHAPSLLEELASDHRIIVQEPPGYGVSAYRSALAEECSTLGVPGTRVGASIEALYVWPMVREMHPQLPGAAMEEQEYPPECPLPEPATIDLRQFPHSALSHAVVVAGAGFGKTALLTALARRLSGTTWLPALVSLAQLADSGQTVMQFLENTVNPEYGVAVPWEYYCDQGRAVMLFDGLDELPSSDRARTLKLVHRFSARYSDPVVAWVLTVRDAAALPASVGGTLLRVDVLDDEEIGAFAEGYRRAGSAVKPTQLLAQLERHRDLHLLARIPLFLALLMATTGESQALPRNRADLIERYLYILLHPEDHKPTAELQCSPSELREVSEHIAFGALERERTWLADREMDGLPSVVGTTRTSDEYIADLRACGLMRRSLNLVGFAFPIVQEYLAACFLVEHLPDEVGQRFELSVRRPWAQTLQFALERHPGADQIVNALLEQEDDAFGTVLRLLARCIINGAPVSKQTRARVGDNLADLWMSRSSHVARTVGRLLADGFTSPVPSHVARQLASGRGLGVGGGEILTAANDPDLTRRALGAFLSQDLEYQYFLHDWQRAVDSVASNALQCYVARVKSDRTSAREIEPLASLIRNLSPQYLPPRAHQSVTNDPTLPGVVRLAGYFLGPRPLPAAALRLADEIIRAPKREGEYRVPGWRLAIDALWCSDDPVERWRTYVFDPSFPEERRREVVFSLPDSLLDQRAQCALLAGLQMDSRLSSDLRHSILLMQAYLGDSDAMDEATELLPKVSSVNLNSWACVASKYRSGDVVLGGLRCLVDLPLDPEQRVRMAGSLSFGLTMDVEFAGQVDGSSGRGRILHVGASECGKIIWDWVNEYEGNEEGCLLLLTAACELGHPGAAQALAGEVTYVTQQRAELFQDFGLDHTVSNALYALERAQLTLPLNLLQQCADISESNAAMQAISMIASMPTQEALATLVQIHDTKAHWDARDSILPHIEELAARVGARFVWDGDRLVQQT